MTTKIKSGVIGDGVVGTTQIADDAISSAKIADNAVGISALNLSDGTNGQVLTTDGSGTLSFADAAGGVDGIVSSADATAITIDSSERVLIGHTAAVPIRTIEQRVQISGVDQPTSGLSLARYQNGAFAPGIHLAKSRNATVGSHTIIQDGDRLGDITFYGSDGTDFANHSAAIMAHIDGTPGANDTPGRLSFHTTADGSGSATERLRITSNGVILGGIHAGSTSPPNYPATFTCYRTGSGGTANETTWGFNASSNGNNLDYAMKVSGTGDYAYGVLNYNENTWMSRLGFDGRIYLTNTTIGSISDRRLKENIVDANSQWDDIKALQFKNYTWKNPERGTGTYLGLIADEVKAISSNLVEVEYATKETLPADGIDPEYEGVKYSIVWMKAVKALQESMTKIETLETKLEAAEARITTLENT